MSRYNKGQYRLYCLYSATLKKQNYKVFKVLYPKPFNIKKSNKFNLTIPFRPINVREKNKLNLRHWYNKHLIFWAQLRDLPDIKENIEEETINIFPQFQTDFYKVQYMITREE